MSSDNEPRFTESLQASYLIREGQPVKLSCRFESSPKGEIEWLKDGIPIDFDALGISRDFKVNSNFSRENLKKKTNFRFLFLFMIN